MTRANATRAQSSKRFAFQRNRLPNPAEYFREHGVAVTGRGEWRAAVCPFHADSKPSLRVRLESGSFRCMACGAHGSDILAFHMQRYGLRFIDAAKALEAWEAQR